MKHSWQKSREPVNTADDWLMTYADMITLLLCFFVVFVSVATHKKEPGQPVQVPVEQPTGLPDILEGNLPFHGSAHAYRPDEVPVENETADSKPADPDAIQQKDGSVTAPVRYLVQDQPEPPPPAPQPEAVTKTPAPEPVAKKEEPPPPPPPAPVAEAEPPASLPQIVDTLKTQGPANIEQSGDRITVMEMSSATFFASGSATLSESGKAVLKTVAVNIKSDKFRDYQITVEGHTDDTPIKTVQFPSNWELSTARASAVVHYFLDEGIPAQRLRAAGYADTFPKAPNRDHAGYPLPANRAQNRRVVIKLEKIEKPDEQGLHQGTDAGGGRPG